MAITVTPRRKVGFFRAECLHANSMKLHSLLFCTILVSVASATPIKIGAVYCNAGPLKVLDEPSWRGAQAAVASRNQAGGIHGQPVELIRIAADSTPASVAAAVRAALQTNPDIAAFIGLSDSDLALAAGREARKAGKVFVTSGATSPLLPKQLGKGFFLACFGDNVQAAAAAEWLRAEDAKKVAVIYDEEQIYTRLLRRYFNQAFTSAGGIVTEQVAMSPGQPVTLPKDLQSCDAVFLSAETAVDAAKVIAKLRAAGFTGPVVGGDGYDNPSTWNGNALAKNVFYTTHTFPARGPGAADAATFSAFRANYRGGTPDAFSGLGFDTARVVMDGLTRNANDLAREIQNRTDVAGVTGGIKYLPGQRVPAKPVAIIDAQRPRQVLRQITPTLVP
jgi:branched-chain amino acid transport system substrate-binding protein